MIHPRLILILRVVRQWGSQYDTPCPIPPTSGVLLLFYPTRCAFVSVLPGFETGVAIGDKVTVLIENYRGFVNIGIPGN